MLTLLSPAALFGLALLAIPIIVHLLKPRKVRQTPFSSLRWLHLTQQRLSRRLRWHQIVLFLLRAAFITLLVFAVAKPIFDRHASATPSERFIILDTSRSMGYQLGDRPTADSTPLDRGKQAASALLAGGGVNDRATLLTVGATTKIVGPPTRGGEAYIPRLATLAAESTDTDLGSALDVAQALLARRPTDSKIKLYVITDSHQGSWQPGAIEEFVAAFPQRVETTIVNVAAAGAQNGWVADARFEPAADGIPAAVDVQVRATGAGGERTIKLIGAAGLSERSQVVTLETDAPAFVHFELPADFDPRGKTCEVVLDPPDGLPSDDRWYLSLDRAASLRVLVVEGRNRAGASASPGFAIRTALEALSTANDPIEVVSKRANEIAPADVTAADVVLWADVSEVSDVVADALGERVRRGLGLGMFLGPGVDIDFYNRRLIDPVHRAQSLLPLRLMDVADVPMSAGGLAPLESVAWDHPLLAGLFDPSLGDLAQVAIRSHVRFAPSSNPDATILATADGSPAIIDHTVGAGKVVVFNLSPDDVWSDLPRRKSFVPLVDRLLNHLSGGLRRTNFTTGSAVAMVLPPLADGESLSVVGPKGESLTPNVSTVGAATRMTLPPLATAGVYRIERRGSNEPASTFVVQTSRGDSTITPIEPELLRTWWQPATVTLAKADDIRTAAIERTSLVAWAVILAALLWGVEMLLVHRLCPRMNPQLATSVVTHRRTHTSGTAASEPMETSLPKPRTI